MGIHDRAKGEETRLEYKTLVLTGGFLGRHKEELNRPALDREIENTIRDLKYGVGLNHLPSGKFAANAVWLALQVLAHNLGVWANRLGLRGAPLRTKTLWHRYLSLAGRLTRSARRSSLALPAYWPWRAEFMAALTRLRSLPLLT